MPLGGAYHASKWATEALNETLAGEVADFGIRVTVIEPAGDAPDLLAEAGGARLPDRSAGVSRLR